MKPGVLVIAHTAVSYLTGFANEPALLDRLAGLTRAQPLTAARAILEALRHLGVRRLALATPYPEMIAAAGRRYWEAAGLEIVAHQGLPGVTNIYEESEARAHALGRSGGRGERRRRPHQRDGAADGRHRGRARARSRQAGGDQPDRHALAGAADAPRPRARGAGYGRLLARSRSGRSFGALE